MSKANELLSIVRNLLSSLSPRVLGAAKAGVGFLVGALVAFLAGNGIELPTETAQAIEAGLYGLVVAIWVYFIPNKQ